MNNDEDENEESHRVRVIGSKGSELKSKRWIITLTCLSLILTLALVVCYINYRICCNSLSQLDQQASSSFLFFKCASSSSNGQDIGRPSPLLSSLSKESSEEYFPPIPDDPGQVTTLDVAGWNSSRLPIHLVPWHYDIRLRIHVYKRQFVGSCAIRVRCNQSISFLVVHADNNLQFMPDKVLNLLLSRVEVAKKFWRILRNLFLE